MWVKSRPFRPQLAGIPLVPWHPVRFHILRLGNRRGFEIVSGSAKLSDENGTWLKLNKNILTGVTKKYLWEKYNNVDFFCQILTTTDPLGDLTT